MSVAVILVAPGITWLLVMTSPLDVTTIPVPAASPPCTPRTVLMSTSPGFTLEVTASETLWLELPPWPDCPASLSSAPPSPPRLLPGPPSPSPPPGARYDPPDPKEPDGPNSRL